MPVPFEHAGAVDLMVDWLATEIRRHSPFLPIFAPCQLKPNDIAPHPPVRVAPSRGEMVATRSAAPGSGHDRIPGNSEEPRASVGCGASTDAGQYFIRRA